MAAACSGYPQRVRHELMELIQKQIDSIEQETHGGATDAERWEYEYSSSGLRDCAKITSQIGRDRVVPLR